MGMMGMNTHDVNPNYTDNNDPEMQYLSKLSKAKRVANEYFLHGRAMRDLPN